MDLDSIGPVVSRCPRSFQTLTIYRQLILLVLAPHPDDFDAIGVTMRFFKENGNQLYVAVATSGARGVEDNFFTPPTLEAKRKIRRQEQAASCRFFGLPENHLTFLRLEEDNNGQLLDNKTNIHNLRRHFQNRRPSLVFLPHWNDTNLTHQRVYALFHQIALQAGYPLAVFLNRDPKTIKMQCDFYLGYGEDKAAWKGTLLRFHQSQHQRNLNQRGYGMDERILKVDRHSALACSVNKPYAEVFEVALFGTQKLDDIYGLKVGT